MSLKKDEAHHEQLIHTHRAKLKIDIHNIARKPT